MTNDEQARMPIQQGLSRVALIITNLTKVSGLIIGFHEALTTKSPTVMAFAAFLCAGARVSEPALLAFINRFFGREAGQE